MKIETLEDMRVAIQKMADVNKVSVTTLNGMSGSALGILRRFMRGQERRRLDGVLVDETTETDIKLSVILKAIDAAGFELVLQQKPTEARRKRVLAAARINRKGTTSDES